MNELGKFYIDMIDRLTKGLEYPDNWFSNSRISELKMRMGREVKFYELEKDELDIMIQALLKEDYLNYVKFEGMNMIEYLKSHHKI